MVKLEEKDFILGNEIEGIKALLISEDCNGFIDSVLDQIYELNLTKEQEQELGIKTHREKYDDSWKSVEFSFGPGNTVLFSRRDSKNGNEIYRKSHELTCHGQLVEDKMISALSGFGIIGSHTLFSYDERYEKLNFDEGTEKEIKIRDGEGQLTQYSKLGITKKPVYKPQYICYSAEYLENDSYKEVYENGKTEYFDLEGKPMTQQRIIATSFDSFDNAYNSFTTKLNMCREIIDARIEEIKQKTK
jgi:hypothetical protein